MHLAAARYVYDALKASPVAYHEDHPTKSVFLDLNSFLKAEMRKKAEAHGPRDGIWTVEEKYFAAGG